MEVEGRGAVDDVRCHRTSPLRQLRLGARRYVHIGAPAPGGGDDLQALELLGTIEQEREAHALLDARQTGVVVLGRPHRVRVAIGEFGQIGVVFVTVARGRVESVGDGCDRRAGRRRVAL